MAENNNSAENTVPYRKPIKCADYYGDIAEDISNNTTLYVSGLRVLNWPKYANRIAQTVIATYPKGVRQIYYLDHNGELAAGPFYLRPEDCPQIGEVVTGDLVMPTY